MTSSDTTSPEAAILGLLNRLADFLADDDQILAGDAHGSVAGDDLLPRPGSPLVLLLRLRTEAMHSFHGLLRLIEDPMATPVAPTVVRSLLECWMHALWIAEGIPGMPGAARAPEDRALCLELGMAALLVSNLARACSQAQPTSTAIDAAAWKNRVEQEHAATGCSCSGRAYSDVQPTPRYLRDSHGMDWPLDTWIAASAAGHALMPHRLAIVLGDTTMWGGPSTPLERQKWLDRGAIALINVYLYVIGTLRRDAVPAFEVRLAAAMADIKAVNALVIAADAAARSAASPTAESDAESPAAGAHGEQA